MSYEETGIYALLATLVGYYFIVPGYYKIVPSRQNEFVTLLGRKILHWGCLGPQGGVLATCFVL
jgi:hypothetical protein